MLLIIEKLGEVVEVLKTELYLLKIQLHLMSSHLKQKRLRNQLILLQKMLKITKFKNLTETPKIMLNIIIYLLNKAPMLSHIFTYYNFRHDSLILIRSTC